MTEHRPGPDDDGAGRTNPGPARAPGEEPGEAPPQCSAKGCRRPAEWALRWNNPKIHPPERRKTWTACDEHREHLAAFLSRRGLLREVLPLDALDAAGDDLPAAGPRPDTAP